MLCRKLCRSKLTVEIDNARAATVHSQRPPSPLRELSPFVIYHRHSLTLALYANDARLTHPLSLQYPQFTVEIRKEHQQTGVNPIAVSETAEYPQCVAEIPRKARDDRKR